MRESATLEKYTSKKVITVVVVLVLFLSIFLANFILAFLQEVGAIIVAMAREEDVPTFSLSLNDAFKFQFNVIEYYIGFYVVIAIGLAKFVYNMRMNYETLNKGQHGTSEFETVKNLKKQYKIIPAKTNEYDGSGGVIVAGLQERNPLLPFKEKPYRLLIDEGPIHTMVIGITRSGKGETFVFPMLDVLSRAKDKPSLVVNDPKGELAGASHDILIERGYEVHVFNLIQQHMGMGFNPLQLVVDAWKSGNVSLAQQYANSITYSLYHNPNAKEPMWDESAASLVTAIILGLTEDAIKTGKEEQVNMYSVASFLSTKGSDNDEEKGTNALDEYFKARDELNPATLAYSTSNFAGGNTRASIFTTAMAKLQIFMLEPNAKLTSYNSLNLTDIGFGDKPIAVFMVTPDYDQSNHVLASIFVSQLYRVNAEKSTMSPSGKMKRHVHFLLDEFGNMPTIDGMAGMVTVGAGRGFRFHLIVQAYSQIKSQYGEESDTIIGNCSNQIYILTKDKQTAEQYSGLLGTKTITDVSRSGKLLSMDKSHSESTKERPLLMADELMQLKEGESVVVRANKRQDNKRRKIVPKPIFNTNETAHKFRWEYLADDFDNDKSILSLPLNSPVYHDIDLSEIVFSSMGEENMYMRMEDVLPSEGYDRLRRMMLGYFEYKKIKNDYVAEFSDWTFVQLFSFLTFVSGVPERVLLNIVDVIKEYIPVQVLDKWERLMIENDSIVKPQEPRDEGRRGRELTETLRKEKRGGGVSEDDEESVG